MNVISRKSPARVSELPFLVDSIVSGCVFDPVSIYLVSDWRLTFHTLQTTVSRFYLMANYGGSGTVVIAIIIVGLFLIHGLPTMQDRAR